MKRLRAATGTWTGGRAFVLVAVLIVVMLTSMLAASLIFRLKAEEQATVAGIHSDQAWSAAMSGVYEALRVAANTKPGEEDWKDAPDLFRNIFVADDGEQRWYFSVFSMSDEPDRIIDYGLSDEASRVHLHEASDQRLMKLPYVRPEMVHALLDFLDPDPFPWPEGAEQEYYDNLPFPYLIRNDKFSTVEEILLVRGFTPDVIYGEDANLNYRLDINEDDGDLRFPPDNDNGGLNQGLRRYFTVSSWELNLTEGGWGRINFNDPEESYNTNEFRPELVTFIDVLRTNQWRWGHASHLLDARVKVKDADGKEVELHSGVGAGELPAVLDRLTHTDEYRIHGLINVNTAPLEVLVTVPGMERIHAETIIAARRSIPPERRRNLAWLFQEKIVDAGQFRHMAPHLTTKSFQFRFQVIGFARPSGRFCVLEAAINVTDDDPEVYYLRDLTRLGLPINILAETGDFDG